MKVTFYKAPHGRTEIIDVANVLPEDAEFFETNNIQIIMEQLNGMIIVYADIGRKAEDDEPNELIEFAQGRSCEDTLHALRLTYEKELAK